MVAQKTLEQRQKELQRLLATPAGRQELEELATQYSAAGSRVRPSRSSVITYLLVHERQLGLIKG
jgi:hypothetical protein